MVRANVEEEIVAIAVDRGEWAVRKFRSKLCAPEVDTIIPRDVDVPNSVFKAMVVVFGRS